MVASTTQVQNKVSSSVDDKNFSKHQAVLIDFGQAVDLRHPEAKSLLLRDLTRITNFFSKQGVNTDTLDDALEFVEDDFGSNDGGGDDGADEDEDDGSYHDTNGGDGEISKEEDVDSDSAMS